MDPRKAYRDTVNLIFHFEDVVGIQEINVNSILIIINGSVGDPNDSLNTFLPFRGISFAHL